MRVPGQPSEARLASYYKVQKVLTVKRADENKPGSKQEVAVFCSGFFAVSDPYALITTANMGLELLRLGLLDRNRAPYEEEVAHVIKLSTIAGTEGTLMFPQGYSSFLDRVVLLPRPLNIDLAALWFTRPHTCVNLGAPQKSPFWNMTLKINPAPIDHKTDYFMPVVKEGKVLEKAAKVCILGHDSTYVFQAKGPGEITGWPLFDEGGEVVGVIAGEVGRGLGEGEEEPYFTPFSVLRSAGLLNPFLLGPRSK